MDLPAAETIRLLVVDDDHDAADSMSTMLRLHGYDVLTALSGSSAHATLPIFRPHVVILDLEMPDMNGLELARRIRAYPATASCTLIAVTGFDDQMHRDWARAGGIPHYLVKPVDIDALRPLFPPHNYTRLPGNEDGLLNLQTPRNRE